MALTLGRRCSPVHPTGVRRPPHSGFGSRHVSPSPPEHRVMGYIWPYPPSRAITRRRIRCQSNRRDSPSPEEQAPQLTRTNPSRTVHPRQSRAPAEPAAGPERNRTASRQDPVPDAAAQAAEQGSTERTANHPEQPIERGKHDSQTSPEENDARIDDEPFHHEAHGTSASVTTTRKPVLRAYTAQVIELPGSGTR